jgi:poly(A) polymerase
VTKKDKALYIIQRLRDEGHDAYLAGGYVRDKLLGKDPKDYDIATSSTPESTQRIFPHTIPVGAMFGSVIVVIDGEPFEVTTFRFDGPYRDGRHPTHIRYGSLEEDVVRRDFTINAMMYDPITERVIDLVNGEEDLRRGVIRAIGDPHQRFAEDRLRMVRAVRLSANLGFVIDETTLAAIQNHASAITDVAWERIGVEITRTLTEGGARKGIELLDETGLLPVLLPEICAMKGAEQSPEHHPEGDVFIHTLLLLEKMEQPTETLAYGCLLHDVAKPCCIQKAGKKITFHGHTDQGAEMAMAIMKRFKRSRAVAETVAWLVQNHLRYTQAPKMRLSTLKRFLREEHIEELLELCRLDALSANGDLTYYNFCKQKLVEFDQDEIRPKPLLTGRDLMEMGFVPGPLFSEILHRMEEAQLEGLLNTRGDAAAWVQEHFSSEE